MILFIALHHSLRELPPSPGGGGITIFFFGVFFFASWRLRVESLLFVIPAPDGSLFRDIWTLKPSS